MINTRLTSYCPTKEHIAIALVETQDIHTLIPRSKQDTEHMMMRETLEDQEA